MSIKLKIISITIFVILISLIGYLIINSNTTPVETTTNTTMKKNTGPKMILKKNKKYQAIVTTDKGEITIDLYADKTPITVNNFVSLSRKGFYNNTIFHRIIKGFMIQGGDPKGDGTGSPGYRFDDEPFTGKYERGTIAMANAGPNTNGSQFFIMHQNYDLQPNYVIYVKVTSGLDVVDAIAISEVKPNLYGEASTPVNPVKITTIKIVEQ